MILLNRLNENLMMLSILYHDEYIVAVNKPAGMLVHRSWLDQHETQFVMQTLRDQLGQLVYPVHRLDRPTSGVLLFALSAEIAHLLSLQLEQHQVEKRYWAVVRGILPEQGRIDYALKPRLDKIADKFANQEKEAETAISEYRRLAETEQPFVSCQRFVTSRYSLAELTPITGRKHQLRRHMKHIFHPIVGDTTYGDKVQNRAILANVGVKRLLLHARSLRFLHPVSQQSISIYAPLDDEFQQVMDKFSWHIEHHHDFSNLL